ncbi:MAG TPA: XRE family transcriptional regulator [Acidimicrobiales bacterium]|jgi:transcriptional regulator with XRE-family HTH domain|nr:XRE family transcriptional regulator [Acidimicrobiales bacterium]
MASDTEALLASVGERLRAARERVGLTLDQTAELAGLSKAHLSRLESAERQPSIAALLTLSEALGTPVSSLLGENQDASPLAISTEGAPRHESKGLSIAACSGYAGSSALEALRITVNPDRPLTPPAHHRGEEWLYVVQGILRLEYDGEVHHLGPGVTAHFDAERPHRLGAEGRRAEVLLVAAKDARNVQTVH